LIWDPSRSGWRPRLASNEVRGWKSRIAGLLLSNPAILSTGRVGLIPIACPSLIKKRPAASSAIGAFHLFTIYFVAASRRFDASSAGLPALTRIGDAFAARIAASLLTACGLDGLIVETPAAYEDLPVALAGARARLEAQKGRPARNRLNAPLFDTETFARGPEWAYAAIYDRLLLDLPAARVLVGAQLQME